MRKVLIYGTFDLFHRGHINLLERAKKYGDELYIGVSSDEFNSVKRKKSFQSLETRMDKVADYIGVKEVFVQNSFEQKKNDVLKYDIDIIVSGDDWKGSIDYLKKYCRVIYLDRTAGISSTLIRNKIYKNKLTLEEIQEISYEILLVVKKICDKNNIIYWLSAGSLLGAVRHNNIIPWDDDIDIAMPRNEFEKFKKIISQELPDFYKVKFTEYYENNMFKDCPPIKILDLRYEGAGSTPDEKNIFVDISPYDMYSQNNFFNFIQRLPKYFKKIKLFSYEDGKNITTLRRKILWMFCKIVNFHDKLLIFIIDKFKKIYNRESDVIFNHSNEITFQGEIHIKDLYPLMETTFRTHSFKIPKNPHNYLRKKYGDYLKIPEEKVRRRTHLRDVYLVDDKYPVEEFLLKKFDIKK